LKEFAEMRISRSGFVCYVSSFFIIFVVSLLVANRSLDIGDTLQYIIHYERISDAGSYIYRLEPGFGFFAYVVSLIGGGYLLFFASVSFLITSTYFFLFKKKYTSIVSDKILLSDILIFFSLLFLSSWYFTSVANGLRQGLSLPFLYLSMFFLVFERNAIKSLICFLIATSFHYSTLLLLPFLPLLYFGFNCVFVVWLGLALGYGLGVNEAFVKYLSDLSGVGIYERVRLYSVQEGEVGQYHGFIWGFFIYTVFWPLFFLFFHYCFFGGRGERHVGFFRIVKIYMILTLPYFVFGFGPFSNRYSYIAWFYIPILQYFIFLFYFKELRLFLRLLSALLFFVSFSYFAVMIS